jgi:uncharacterized OB-fold protein
MALITCKECGKQVSSKARTCPGCGSPTQREESAQSFVGIATVLIVLVLTFSWVYKAHPEWIGLKKKNAADRMMESMQESIDEMKKYSKKTRE